MGFVAGLERFEEETNLLSLLAFESLNVRPLAYSLYRLEALSSDCHCAEEEGCWCKTEF